MTGTRLRDASCWEGERALAAVAGDQPAPGVAARGEVTPRRWRGGTRLRRSLVAADLVALVVAFLISLLLLPSGVGDRLARTVDVALFVLTLPGWVLVAQLHGLYDCDEKRLDYSFVDDLAGVFHLVTVGAWLFVVGSFVTGFADPDPPRLFAFWVLAVALVPIARAAARATCRRSAGFVQNTLIVGAGDVAQLIARKIVKHPEYGMRIVGFADARPRPRRVDLPEDLTILGPAEEVRAIILRKDVERVIVCFSNDSVPETLDLVRTLHDLDVQVDIVPRLFELLGPRVVTHSVEGLTLIALPRTRLSRSSRLLKRTFDVAGASIALVLAAPLFAYIALRIKRDSPGPVFFRQTRLGCEAREFTALKFRTMKVDVDNSAHREYISRIMSSAAVVNENGIYKLAHADAITHVGHWLRRTSLDELPQLLNVLKGDMSLVGPRPCIPYETEHFKSYHFERFHMPQGLTGLWQVTARANSTFAEALDMDVAYVRGWSLGLDLRLLLRTPIELIRQRSSTA